LLFSDQLNQNALASLPLLCQTRKGQITAMQILRMNIVDVALQETRTAVTSLATVTWSYPLVSFHYLMVLVELCGFGPTSLQVVPSDALLG